MIPTLTFLFLLIKVSLHTRHWRIMNHMNTIKSKVLLNSLVLRETSKQTLQWNKMENKYIPERRIQPVSCIPIAAAAARKKAGRRIKEINKLHRALSHNKYDHFWYQTEQIIALQKIIAKQLRLEFNKIPCSSSFKKSLTARPAENFTCNHLHWAKTCLLTDWQIFPKVLMHLEISSGQSSLTSSWL